MPAINPNLGNHCTIRAGEVKRIRQSWEPGWREIERYQLPNRGDFFRTPNQGSRGTKKNQAIVDSTSGRSVRVTTAGLMGGLTPRSQPWARLTVPDKRLADSAAVRLWLDHVMERMLMIFGQSNVYEVLLSLYEELAGFGTGCALLQEDFEDVLRLYPQTVGTYWLAANNRRVIDTFYREYALSARSTIREFGEDNVSQAVRDKKGKPGADGNVMICHLIEPNDEFEEGALGARGKKWRSVTWEKGATEGKFLRLSGYEKWPVLCPRWRVLSDDPYGTGCGHDADSDVKSLQVLGKRRHNAVDKHVNPAMAFPAELKNQATGTTPGFANYFAGNLSEKVGRPLYQTNPSSFAPLQALIVDLRQIIKEHYFADLFLMISQSEGIQPRNQLEIMARKEEKLLMLGPVLESLHGELLKPLVLWMYDIMFKHRLFEPPPEELHGWPLEVEMISMLAQAQNAARVGAIERETAFIGSLIGAFPQAGDKIDIYDAIDKHSDGVGVPAGMIRSTDDAQKIADERAKQLQAEKAMQTGMALTQGAKNLSDANMGGGNMLERVTGTQPQQAAA